MNRRGALFASCFAGVVVAGCGRHDEPVPVTVPVVASVSAPPPVVTANPPVSSDEPGPQPPGLADADRTLGGLRPRFRACYNEGLKKDPSLAGKVIMATRVDAAGEVVLVDTTEHYGLTPEVIDCMAKVLRGAHFSAPGGTGTTLSVPVTFVQQK